MYFQRILSGGIIWLSIFHANLFSEHTKIIEGVNLKGRWEFQKSLSSGELNLFDGEISGSKARFLFGTKPFFPTVVPRSLDLFRSFSNIFLRKAPISWKDFHLDPDAISSYQPDEIQMKGISTKASLGIIPLANPKNTKRLLLFSCVFDHRPYYLLWYPPPQLKKEEAYQKIINLFHFQKNNPLNPDERKNSHGNHPVRNQ